MNREVSRKMEKESLKKALAGIRNGKDDDFAVVSAAYESLLRSLAGSFYEKCKHLGAEFEDLLQESAMGLYKAAITYELDREEVTFGLYAKICITNRLISVQRKLIRANAKKPVKEDRTRKYACFPKSGRQITDIDSYTGTLSRLERDVFTLYLKGCSYNEIAEKLQKDVKSVDNAIYRIKKKLKELRNGV